MTDQIVAHSGVSEPGGEDLSANPSTVGRVAVDGTARGEIQSEYDQDWFAVELHAGAKYRIELKGLWTEDGTLFDPRIAGLYDAHGTLVAGTRDENGGEGMNALLEFTPASSGTYYISADSPSAWLGTYELSVAEVTPPVAQEQVQDPPSFRATSYVFALSENADGSGTGVSVGRVSASDPEGSAVTYSIADGNDAGLFAIDAASGELSYVGTGEDYESGAGPFELTVRASDGALSAEATVTVTVTDVDEAVIVTAPVFTPSSLENDDQPNEAPSFEEASYAFDLSENADGSVTGVSVGRVSASDPEGSAVTYSIADGDGSGLFAIDAASGELSYVGAGEDYESGAGPFELTVRASDGALSAEATVTVRVTDVDEAPGFAQDAYAFDLAENTDGSTDRVSLGTVSATDPEGARLSYSIAGGNEPGLFEIDGTSGELFYVGSGEDYETGTGSFNLTVRTSDGDLSADTTVRIAVSDENEAPAFGQDSYAFALSENADGSTDRVSLGTVSATDPEGAGLSYSIAGGNDAGLFEVDAASGELFYVGSGEDYETGTGSFDLTVRAGDGTYTADAAVTVDVTDVEETAPEPVGGVSANDREGEGEQDQAPADADSVRAGATDLGDITGLAGPQFPRHSLDGEGDAVDYYRFELSDRKKVGLGLRRQDADADLYLEDSEGTVLASSERGGTSNEWIAETLGSGTYYVRVESREVGRNDHIVRYGVTDPPPDEAPSFDAASYAFALSENADGSTDRVPLGTVTATDPEGSAVTYGIAVGNDAGLFAIDAASGELFYVGAGEDYESGGGPFELTVRASDGRQTVEATVRVTVTDENEAPAFGQDAYGFDLAENADGSTDRVLLGTVSASDPEGEAPGYSIEGGNDAGLFAIDAASGELFYVGAGEDYESGAGPFELTVRASDGVHTAEATVEVTLTDVAEDYADNIATTGVVAVGGMVMSEVEVRGDRDWFKVELEADKFYRIVVAGVSRTVDIEVISDVLDQDSFQMGLTKKT